MNRVFALIGALLLASMTVSSTCMAGPAGELSFFLDGNRDNEGKIDARFDNERGAHDRTDWTGGFLPSDLIGLDIAGFRGSGTRPLRFALVRDPGRLDCSGNGGSGYARGTCRFTPDPSFVQFMADHGMARPTEGQGLGLMALNVKRELIDAVASAGYPAPKIDDLTSLAALGVDGGYIRGMARAGYRPRSLQTLVELKAMSITPDWIAGFVRAGYGNLPSNDLIQLKALSITPDFISGFDRIGYRNIRVETLVQLKALGITPD